MLYCNIDLASEEAWVAQNGATRRTLKVINKLGKEFSQIDCKISTLDKGNHSFIFLNPGTDKRILGLFVCNGYGYTVIGQPEDIMHVDGIYITRSSWNLNHDDCYGKGMSNKQIAEQCESADRCGEIYTASSVGGPGNSESRFGIYEVGTLIYTHTYKNRQTGEYYKLTNDGWKNIPAFEVEANQAVQI